MFDGNPALRERFPQGVMQFAQLAAQLPEDALIDLFMQAQAAAQGEGVGNDRMPGEFVEFVDPFDSEEEIEDAEDPDDGHLEHPVVAGAQRDGSDHGEEGEDEDEDIAVRSLLSPRHCVLCSDTLHSPFRFGCYATSSIAFGEAGARLRKIHLMTKTDSLILDDTLSVTCSERTAGMSSTTIHYTRI